ncbi:MAG TPA: ribosome maturation factor RimM [Chloroflexota bacterium]|nr:ribosome maturation factor RimM [Chloroflexota bacterium]
MSPNARTPPNWLYVGRITAPFGVGGELRVMLETEFPERLPERPLFVGTERRQVVVEGLRQHGREALLKLGGVNTVDAADGLRGQELFVALADAAPLPAGRFYPHQIVGLAVWTAAGDKYGVVSEVLSRPANDIYVVRHADREVLVPAIADVVKLIDTAAGRMVIEVVPGLE